jgi:hypothetical protein
VHYTLSLTQCGSCGWSRTTSASCWTAPHAASSRARGLKNFVFQLESSGCELNKELPKLRALLHLAMAVCRKGEGAAVAGVIKKKNGQNG